MQDSIPIPVRVAIVVASLRILGGQAVQAERILAGWRQTEGVDAWVIPTNPVPREPFDRLLDLKYIRTLVTQACYWPLLHRDLRRADVVHVFSASYWSFLLSTVPAILVAKLLGKPVVLNYHSGEAPDHLQRSAIARYVMRRGVELNVVPSSFLQGVLESFGIESLVVPNTVDLWQFRYRVRNPLRPRLLCTRNFEPMYNLPCVIKAFARIQHRFPDATLTLVGSGSQEQSLRLLARRLTLRRITFAGRVPPSDIQRYYDSADIYIQAPSIDNMPLSLLEAFASGLPVVSTRAGGIPAMLRHGVHGLLAPLDDPGELAARVLELLEHPGQARDRAAQAYDTLLEYTWPVVSKGWLMAYGQAIDRHRARASARPIPSTPSSSA